MVFGSTHNSPACWSRQFEEGDRECRRCDYNVSCKDAYLKSNGMQIPQMVNPHLTPSVQQNRIPVVPPPPVNPSIQVPTMVPQTQIPVVHIFQYIREPNGQGLPTLAMAATKPIGLKEIQ